MKYLISTLMTIILLLIGTAALAAEADLPVIKGKKIVATVNGEPITLEEYKRDLASLDTKEGEKKAEKEQSSALLKRLINTRLIVQEGKRSGLDELPEIKQRVEVFARVTLRDELMGRHVKDIKAGPQEVDKFYKDSIKEVKTSSVLFEKEDGAKKFEKAIKEGSKFEETLQKFLSDKTAKGSEVGKYLKYKEVMPEIASAIGKLKIGEMSPIVRLKSGFVISRLEDIRYTEDPEAKEWAKQEALKQKQKDALAKLDKDLKKKYSKVNQKIVDSLDFGTKEKFEKLLKDKRVVVEITGEKPITVGELAENMRQQLFHGVDRAIESKRLEKRKAQTFEEMIQKRVLMKEALRLGIDKTDSYKSLVKEHEDSLVFGAYVQKAVVPEVKLQEKEVEDYYNAHIKEFTYPEMMRMNSLVFRARKDAESAIEKLKKGVEFKWLVDNAEGQVDKNKESVMNFDGTLLTVKDFPEEFQKAVSGARSEDSRLYESSKGHVYVLAIQEVIPSKPQPYQEAGGEIAKKVYNEKLKKAVEDLADKLRALSDVRIYLKDEN